MKTTSKLPRKQRLARYDANLHERGKFLSAHLSKELREMHGKRNVRVRTGDKVKILRGNFKGRSGIVSLVDIKKEKIFIEGVEGVKKDGTKVKKSFVPSNLLIIALNLEDKKRKAKLTKSEDVKTTKVVKEIKND
ncbi:MAG: 50S ribosomal protein L24 [Nanoarchaeota archaeon]|nr:50S ribosomal protein L24 [Nanoarchaeota archaeon]